MKAPDLKLPLTPSGRYELYTPLQARFEITTKNALELLNIWEFVHKPPFLALLNTPKAAWADWFIFFPKVQDVPPFLRLEISKPFLRWKPNEIKKNESSPFLLLGQSKRYRKTPLSASVVKDEIHKVKPCRQLVPPFYLSNFLRVSLHFRFKGLPPTVGVGC